MRKPLQILDFLVLVLVLALPASGQEGIDELRRCMDNFKLKSISDSEFDHCFESFVKLNGHKVDNLTDSDRQEFRGCLRRFWDKQHGGPNATVDACVDSYFDKVGARTTAEFLKIEEGWPEFVTCTAGYATGGLSYTEFHECMDTLAKTNGHSTHEITDQDRQNVRDCGRSLFAGKIETSDFISCFKNNFWKKVKPTSPSTTTTTPSIPVEAPTRSTSTEAPTGSTPTETGM